MTGFHESPVTFHIYIRRRKWYFVVWLEKALSHKVIGEEVDDKEDSTSVGIYTTHRHKMSSLWDSVTLA